MPTVGQGRRQSVTVVPQTPAPLLDAFMFDLVRTSTISYGATVTKHPVQNGAEGPSDQIVLDPPVMTVTGLTGNTPVVPLSDLSRFFTQIALAAGAERMLSLTELLVQMHRLKLLCTVYCSWHKPLVNYYPNVIDLSRDQSSGNTINKNVTFTHLRIVNSLTIPAMQDEAIVALTESRLEFGPVSTENA